MSGSRMSKRRGLPAIFPAAAVLVVPAGAALGGGVGLSPHQAVYEITLERAANSSGIADMSGRMVYELVGGACSGYTQKMRFVTRVVDREGQSVVNDLRTSSWEDAAGRNMRFLQSQYRGRELTETTEGTVDRTTATGDIEVELSQPTTRAIALDGPVYFPIQHSVELLKAAREGRRQFPARLYDGSEQGETVYETSTFIGKALPGETAMAGVPAAVRQATRLEGLSAWPVAISYYEAKSKGTDAAPNYELAFRFHDNGVSSNLFIDYGDFAIRGELRELKMLEPEACEGK